MEYALTPKTPEGVKVFVERYGFPEQGFHPIDIRNFYIGIDSMKEAVDAWKTGERTGNYEDMLDCFNSPNPDDSSILILQQFSDRIRPSIVAWQEGFVGAMMAQLAQAVVGDIKIKKCEWNPCPSWLTYGPGTGRRKSGRYCSDRCRKAAHRAGSANIGPASADGPH